MHSFFIDIDFNEIITATTDTLIMIGISLLISTIIAIPISLVLYFTSKNKLYENRLINSTISFIINTLRSLPFLVLLIVMIPITKFLVGTTIGLAGIIPPLIIGTFPMIVRLMENSLLEIDDGIILMARSYGCNVLQIIRYVLFPEVLPNLISNLTVTAITLLSFTSVAGVVGGGGLGDIAIRYGYERFQTNVLILTVIILIILVQLIQLIGNIFVTLIKKK